MHRRLLPSVAEALRCRSPPSVAEALRCNPLGHGLMSCCASCAATHLAMQTGDALVDPQHVVALLLYNKRWNQLARPSTPPSRASHSSSGALADPQRVATQLS